MWDKIKGFFGSFFHNIVADPVSTAKGVVQLAAAGAACYGMVTGVVPVNQVSTGFAAAAAASGLHALGTDTTTGTTAPAIVKAEELIQTAAAVTPQALTIADHYQAIKDQAGQAQAILNAATEAATALSTLSPTVASTSAVQPVLQTQTEGA